MKTLPGKENEKKRECEQAYCYSDPTKPVKSTLKDESTIQIYCVFF